MLFFKSVAALLDPAYRKETIKWGLVSYTVVMFSVATVQTAMNLHIQSMSHTDNRDFPGIDGEISPGPIGYMEFITNQVLSIVPEIAFFLNAWLADGLLVSSPLDAMFTHPCV